MRINPYVKFGKLFLAESLSTCGLYMCGICQAFIDDT